MNLDVVPEGIENLRSSARVKPENASEAGIQLILRWLVVQH